MTDEPDLEIVKVPDARDDGWPADRARQKEAARPYRERVLGVLTELARSPVDLDNQAAAILSSLFAPARIDGGGPCPCSCHPRLPESDLHGYGFDCSCQWTAEERRRSFESWSAETDAYWASADGQAVTDEHAADEAALTAWLTENPEVTVASHGGMAPEQWWGDVDGRSFYFRERHDKWRIEVDLRPTGRFYRARVRGDLDEDNSFEDREIDAGDVIAEGTTSVDGYGTAPVERAQFITATIRAHLVRQRCAVHRDELDDPRGAVRPTHELVPRLRAQAAPHRAKTLVDPSSEAPELVGPPGAAAIAVSEQERPFVAAFVQGGRGVERAAAQPTSCRP